MAGVEANVWDPTENSDQLITQTVFNVLLGT